MNTKKTITALLLTAMSMLHQNTIVAQSGVKQIIKAYKANLDPYEYDSYASNKIVFDSAKTQTVEVEFAVFAKQQYKLVICTSGFQEQVKVNIYDKSKRCKKRTKIYDSENGIDNLFWSFEPPKTGTYFIEYEIPASTNKKIKEGYMIMIVGSIDHNYKQPLALK